MTLLHSTYHCFSRMRRKKRGADGFGESCGADVDATTSASVLPPGNTAKMANWIRERVGGDLFSIVVEEPYSDDYDECLDRAADEKAENARPQLVNHVENDGKKGELSYYDPWGDVFMLYEDFYAGDEMHRLGVCMEGMEELEVRPVSAGNGRGTISFSHVYS